MEVLKDIKSSFINIAMLAIDLIQQKDIWYQFI